MATEGGPNVVEDGLVLALDAANTKSYPGSGTAWNDLSGHGLNGTIVSSPSFSTDNSGILDFDGTDDYISISTYTFGHGNWPVNIWMQSDNGGTYNLVSNSSGGPVTNAMGFGSNKIFYANYDGAWQYHGGNTTLSTGEWYMLTWVNYAGASANLGTMQMFVNGTSDSSIFNSYTVNGGPCDAIGRNWFSYFNGRIGNVLVCNKALTASEVLQNYNATKGRFGL